MSEIRWDESMYIGVETIDSQHEKLVFMINELYYAYMEGREKSVLADSITSINEYARTHFATESELMSRHDYPEQNSHLAEHRDFMARSVDFSLAYLHDKEELTAEMLDYLMDWWSRHIKGTDKRLGRFLTGRATEA